MLTPDYISGLVDGEGSFTVYVRDPNDSRPRVRRVRAAPRFYLKLVEADKIVLDELKDFFGCGNVYFQKDKRQNHQQCYRYEVAGLSDLENIIIPFFKEHPPHLPSRAKDFIIFCQLIELMKQRYHLNEVTLAEMHRIKQGMH
jgi:LAGLIDADG endonuclease